MQSVITNMADTRTCEAVALLARNILFDIINFILEELRTTYSWMIRFPLRPLCLLERVPPTGRGHHPQMLQCILPSPITVIAGRATILKTLSVVDCFQKKKKKRIICRPRKKVVFVSHLGTCKAITVSNCNHMVRRFHDAPDTETEN